MDQPEFWEADEIEPIARGLIYEHHRHLWEGEAGLLYLFTSKERKSKGRVVLGTAQLASSLQRFLTQGRQGGAVDFILIFDHVRWKLMLPEHRAALVDHELCHCIQTAAGDWAIRGHDLEEFTDIVRRHGLWRPDVIGMAAAMKPYQYQLPLQPPSAAAMEAAQNLANSVGKDGITGMTLSSGEHTVTFGTMPPDDRLYDRAVRLVQKEGRASTHLLHDRLFISWDDAARLLERLIAAGVIGAATSE